MPTTVVNARVEAEDVRMARRTLEREGHTLSWAIRTMVEYIARTGSVPQLVADEDDAAADSNVPYHLNLLSVF